VTPTRQRGAPTSCSRSLSPPLERRMSRGRRSGNGSRSRSGPRTNASLSESRHPRRRPVSGAGCCYARHARQLGVPGQGGSAGGDVARARRVGGSPGGERPRARWVRPGSDSVSGHTQFAEPRCDTPERLFVGPVGPDDRNPRVPAITTNRTRSEPFSQIVEQNLDPTGRQRQNRVPASAQIPKIDKVTGLTRVNDQDGGAADRPPPSNSEPVARDRERRQVRPARNRGQTVEKCLRRDRHTLCLEGGSIVVLERRKITVLSEAPEASSNEQMQSRILTERNHDVGAAAGSPAVLLSPQLAVDSRGRQAVLDAVVAGVSPQLVKRDQTAACQSAPRLVRRLRSRRRTRQDRHTQFDAAPPAGQGPGSTKTVVAERLE
jgi:hypothetical protein